MKPVKLAILCSVLAVAGCGDKNEADTAKSEQGSMIEQAKDAASTAADTAGQMASDTAAAAGAAADAAQDTAAAAVDATAEAAADAAGAVGDTAAAADDAAAEAVQAGQEAVSGAAAAVEGAMPATGDATAAAGAAAAATAVAPAAGDATAGADLAMGQSVYEGKCKACHATGAAGSPKLDDKANWAPRIAQGMDTLVKHAIEGFKGTVGYMPPKGGFATLTDDEVKASVAYMVSQAQ